MKIWKVKWRYTDRRTKRSLYHEDYCLADTEEKAMEKENIYRQLFEVSCGCKLQLISWKEYNEL